MAPLSPIFQSHIFFYLKFEPINMDDNGSSQPIASPWVQFSVGLESLEESHSIHDNEDVTMPIANMISTINVCGAPVHEPMPTQPSPPPILETSPLV